MKKIILKSMFLKIYITFFFFFFSSGLRLAEVNALVKYSVTMNIFLTFSMSDPNTQSRSLHSLKHDGRRRLDTYTHKSRFEPTRLIMGQSNIRTYNRNE